MMAPADRQAYIDRYGSRLAETGYSPKTLGWGRWGRQEVRFLVLSELALLSKNGSVLDVGCGFADLYEYLVGSGWSGRYVGIDINPELLTVARQRHPDLELTRQDIGEFDSSTAFDFVIASGVFNAKLTADDNKRHIERSVRRMFEISIRATCVDFLSTRVDYQHPSAWHTDPQWAIALASELSGRFSIRHDYMPYEFALFVFKDRRISPRNVFATTEERLAELGRPAFPVDEGGE